MPNTLIPTNKLRPVVAALAAAVLTVGLTGCGSDGDGDQASAQSAAQVLQANIDDIDKVVPLTEDNDANDLLGRPNGYVAATVIFDARSECLDGNTEPGVDCGATIEQWPSKSAAKKRADYIAALQEGSSLFGSEWHHIREGLLLRVSGNLKPSEAAVYEDIFMGEDLAADAAGVTTTVDGAEADDAAAETGVVAFEDIDTALWTGDLIAAGDVRTDPDLMSLYDLTVEDCAKESEDLEIGLTLTGARPDVMRVSMKHVCPAKAHIVDDALTAIQDSAAQFDEACSTPKSLRTEEQQMKFDAIGCS